jgi:DNA-binding NarL/FixJ family response regulator
MTITLSMLAYRGRQFRPKLPSPLNLSLMALDDCRLDLSVLLIGRNAPHELRLAATLRQTGLAVDTVRDATIAEEYLLARREIGVLVMDAALLEGNAIKLAATVLGGSRSNPERELLLVTAPEEPSGLTAGQATAATCAIVAKVHLALAKTAIRRALANSPGSL